MRDPEGCLSRCLYRRQFSADATDVAGVADLPDASSSDNTMTGTDGLTGRPVLRAPSTGFRSIADGLLADGLQTVPFWAGYEV